jgi:hypothetical protein
MIDPLAMNWSKLRAKVRANLCEELRDRLDFHMAVYRTSPDSDRGRGWISLDGQQIGSWSYFEELLSPLTIEEMNARFPEGWAGRDSVTLLNERGVYSDKAFKGFLEAYLELDPHDALSSPIPLTRALAVSDKRIGRRTLARFAIHEEPDGIVRLLFRLRTQQSQTRKVPERPMMKS